MDKFRYSIDLGSGYVLTEVHDNKLKLVPSKTNSLRVETKKLTGSIVFAGDNAENAFNLRTTNYLVPFLIEEWNGSSWNDLFECNADLRGQYLRNSRTLTIDTFEEAESVLSIFLGSLQKSYKTTDLGLSPNGVAQTITSTRLDILSNPTALTQAAYIAAFDLEGNAINVEVDTRWNYFRFYSTSGSSPNWIHTYSARSFNYRPGSMNFQREYVKIQQGNTNSWVKLPPVSYTEESWTPVLSVVSYRLDLFLDAIVSGIDSSLSFDFADAGDFINTNYRYIGDGDEFNGSDIKGIEFTLQKLFDFFQNYLNYSWYIDSNKLKFKSNAWKFSNSLLDWSSETVSNDDVVYAYNPMPDRERWKMGDESLDRFLISYFDKDIKTSNNELDYSTDMVHDFWTLLQEGKSAGKLVWIELNSGTGVVVVNTMQDFFDSSLIGASFSSYARFIIPTDPSSVYSIVPLGQSDTRPVIRLKHNKWIDDYSAFDLLVRINTDFGLGYLNSYEIDLNTGIGTFDLWYV